MDEMDFAVVVPMANEQETFKPFTDRLKDVLDSLAAGHIYIVVDQVSKDDTFKLSRQLSTEDERFTTVWAPENRNVADAYIRGLREAYLGGHEAFIEMDAGLSHDPNEIPSFLMALSEGFQCVFGSRYIHGGKNLGPPINRELLSKGGTLLSNLLLGTKLEDMTSGFEAFNRHTVKNIISYPLKSRAHFIQTEIRYLMRNTRYKEIPIVYRSPSHNVSVKALRNSIYCLIYYLFLRVRGRAPSLISHPNQINDAEESMK
jgi:dolichol-phosphate mannosyltransferase